MFRTWFTQKTGFIHLHKSIKKTMSNSAVLNSLIHTKTQPRKIPLTVSPYSLIHTKNDWFQHHKKTMSNPAVLNSLIHTKTQSRKIPLTVYSLIHTQKDWFQHSIKKMMSNPAVFNSLIHTKIQSRKIPLSVASQSDSHKDSVQENPAQCSLTVWFTQEPTKKTRPATPHPNPHPRPPPLEVGEKLPEWRVTLHLYVWQQVRMWGNGCTRYLLTKH